MHELRLFKSNVDNKLTRNQHTFVRSKLVYKSFQALIYFADKCLEWNVIQNEEDKYKLEYTNNEDACLQVFFLWLHYELHGTNLYIEKEILGKSKDNVRQMVIQVVGRIKTLTNGYFYVEFDSGIGIGFKRNERDNVQNYNSASINNSSFLEMDFFNVDVKLVVEGREKSKTIACGLFDVWYKVRDLFNDDPVQLNIENVVGELKNQAYAMTELELAFATWFNVEAIRAMNMQRYDPDQTRLLIDQFEKYMQQVLEREEERTRREQDGNDGTQVDLVSATTKIVRGSIIGGKPEQAPPSPVAPSSPDDVTDPLEEDKGNTTELNEMQRFYEWLDLRSLVCRLEFWKRVLARSKLKPVARIKRIASAEVVKALTSNEGGFKRNSEYDISLMRAYNLVAGIQKKYYWGERMDQD